MIVDRITVDMARYAVALADAIDSIQAQGRVGYGQFHTQEIPIYFDGDPAGCYLQSEDDIWHVVIEQSEPT